VDPWLLVGRLALAAVLFPPGRPAGPQAPPSARSFRVDASASRVTIKVGRAGLFKFVGHEHEVSALGFSGEVVADPAQLAGSSVRLAFEAAALRVTGTTDSAEDLPKIQETMSGPRLLDVARFPEARFDSRAVSGRREADGSWAIVVTGELRLRAVARPLTLPMRVELSADTLVATGRAAIRQTDFGLQPVSVGGVVKVKNELPIDYRIVARAAP
jgi:polyisoprenoid-binding protein YceI